MITPRQSRFATPSTVALAVIALAVGASSCADAGTDVESAPPATDQDPTARTYTAETIVEVLPPYEVELLNRSTWPTQDELNRCWAGEPVTRGAGYVATAFIAPYSKWEPGTYEFPTETRIRQTESSLTLSFMGPEITTPTAGILATKTLEGRLTRADATVYARFVGESRRGATIYVWSGTGQEDRLSLAEGLSVRPDGSVVTVTNCNTIERSALDGFLEYTASIGDTRTAKDFAELTLTTDGRKQLEAIREKQKTHDAELRAEKSGWNSRPPDHRSYLDGGVPPELTVNLTPFRAIIEVPDAWLDSTARICTRTTDAWNSCFRLEGTDFWEHNRHLLEGQRRTDEPLQLWVKDDKGNAIAKIADLPPESFDADKLTLVRLTDPRLATTEPLTLGTAGITTETITPPEVSLANLEDFLPSNP